MMSQIALSRPAAASGRRVSFLTRLMQLDSLYRQRAQLAGLDETRLKDIGLSLDDAREEARRPVWDAPLYWRA